jgi:hypothetical protein
MVLRAVCTSDDLHMGATAVRALLGLRGRGRAIVLLVAALGLAGAVAIASVAGSIRGGDALDRFLAVNRPGSVEAFVSPELSPADQVALLGEMAEASGTDDVAQMANTIVALPGPGGVRSAGTDLLVAFAVLDGPMFESINVPIVVDGSLPLPRGAVAVNQRLADRRGVQPGDTVPVALFDREATEILGNGGMTSPRAVIDAPVGAVIRQPGDLARSPQAQPGTLFEGDESRLWFGQGFWDEYGPDLASYGMGLVADIPPSRLGDAAEAMRAVGGDLALVAPGEPEDLARLEPVRRAIELESNALLVLALLVGVVGLGILGPAIGRATGERDDDLLALRGMGFTTPQLLAIRAQRAAIVALAAGVVAVAVAIPLSALFPIGIASDAEVDPGIRADVPVLALGFAAVLIAVLGRALLGGAFAGRRSRTDGARPGRVAPLLALLRPVPAIGARMAVEGSGGGGRAARAAAVVTAVVGVAALTGSLTFATSLSNLYRSPDRQGWTWDVTVGNYSRAETAAAASRTLDEDPGVDAHVAYNWTSLVVDGELVHILNLADTTTELAPVLLEGRPPLGGDEVAFGRATLDQLGKDLGDTVELDGIGTSAEATIVGIVVAPAVVVPPMDLDAGGVVDTQLIGRLFPGQPDFAIPLAHLVRIADDADRQAVVDRLRAAFPGTVLGPMQPLALQDLWRVRGFPYALASMLGLLALVSVIVTLASTARRRRREIAVLRSLGVDRRQVRGLVAAHATTFALVAACIGVPIGIAGGRLAWLAAAESVGSEVGPLVPVLTIAGATVGALVVLNVVAQIPATRLAARVPAVDLREE